MNSLILTMPATSGGRRVGLTARGGGAAAAWRYGPEPSREGDGGTMGNARWNVRRLTRLGAAAVVAGVGLISTAILTASATATPTIAMTINTSVSGSCNSSTYGPVCSDMTGGDTINVSGSGFSPATLASVLECNTDPTQPQIYYLNNDIPVSCSNIVPARRPSSTRHVHHRDHSPSPWSRARRARRRPATPPPAPAQDSTTTTTMITGCSTSGNAATDAAAYPCPPTPTQQAAGDMCIIAVGDTNGERAIGALLFGAETLPGCPGAGTTTTAPVPCSTTSIPPLPPPSPAPASTTFDRRQRRDLHRDHHRQPDARRSPRPARCPPG